MQDSTGSRDRLLRARLCNLSSLAVRSAPCLPRRPEGHQPMAKTGTELASQRQNLSYEVKRNCRPTVWTRCHWAAGCRSCRCWHRQWRSLPLSPIWNRRTNPCRSRPHGDRRQVGHNQTTVIAPCNAIARLAAADESKAYQLTVRRPRKHYARCALSIGDRRSVKSCT